MIGIGLDLDYIYIEHILKQEITWWYAMGWFPSSKKHNFANWKPWLIEHPRYNLRGKT